MVASVTTSSGIRKVGLKASRNCEWPPEAVKLEGILSSPSHFVIASILSSKAVSRSQQAETARTITTGSHANPGRSGFMYSIFCSEDDPEQMICRETACGPFGSASSTLSYCVLSLSDAYILTTTIRFLLGVEENNGCVFTIREYYAVAYIFRFRQSLEQKDRRDEGGLSSVGPGNSEARTGAQNPDGEAVGFGRRNDALQGEGMVDTFDSERGKDAENQLRSLRHSTIFPDLYAPSGFDMMGILVRVRTRPNPKIKIGSVDSAVALVLCDTSLPDMPIVYCSETFEALTGYSSSEIMGRNCRFLQEPFKASTPRGDSNSRGEKDKNIQVETQNAESKKDFKHKIMNGEEAQIQLVNYRKSGEIFDNVVTVIPISWDENGGDGMGSEGKRYLVGFQVDSQFAFRL
ncbi:hypothetical protein B7494_g4161 [Chlorociboria aeruginascens]|nr:hypothetical protein B7494_g4161 [Chlorociboria aeruginascens]